MDPVTAGLSLITTIVKMIADAKTAGSEEHASIVAKFEAASQLIADSAQSANDALADEIAKDKEALKVHP